MSEMYKIVDVDDVDIAFQANALRLMPSRDALPKKYEGRAEFEEFTSDWFFKGADIERLKPKSGVDTTKALRHLKVIMGSFQPKHEHKIEGVAWLLSQWFELVKP